MIVTIWLYLIRRNLILKTKKGGKVGDYTASKHCLQSRNFYPCGGMHSGKYGGDKTVHSGKCNCLESVMPFLQTKSHLENSKRIMIKYE